MKLKLVNIQILAIYTIFSQYLLYIEPNTQIKQWKKLTLTKFLPTRVLCWSMDDTVLRSLVVLQGSSIPSGTEGTSEFPPAPLLLKISVTFLANTSSLPSMRFSLFSNSSNSWRLSGTENMYSTNYKKITLAYNTLGKHTCT